MTPLYQAIVDHVPAPDVDLDGPFQMQISQLDYNSYVGVIGIGRIKRGKVKPNQQVTIIDSEGKPVTRKSVKCWATSVWNVLKPIWRKLAISWRSRAWAN